MTLINAWQAVAAVALLSVIGAAQAWASAQFRICTKTVFTKDPQ
jgi:hypothetical protein